MPQPSNYTIRLPAGTPATLTCNTGDHVTFTNNTGYSITAFTLPTCLSPKTSPTFPWANGSSSIQYTVNGNPNTNYNYTYSYSPTNTDQAGTIDVSS